MFYPEPNRSRKKSKPCSLTLTYSPGSVDLRLPQTQLERYTTVVRPTVNHVLGEEKLEQLSLLEGSSDLVQSHESPLERETELAEHLPLERGSKPGMEPIQGNPLEHDFSSPLEHRRLSLDAKDFPLEPHFCSRGEDLNDRLAELEKKRNAIKLGGFIAPHGVWIEFGKVSKRKFRQAYYRSTKPIFPAKRQSSLVRSDSGLVKRSYIGEEHSQAVKAAAAAIARRKELERIQKEIELIERRLSDE